MAGNDDERDNFIKLDKIYGYRTNLIEILKSNSNQLGLSDYLDICLGGSVGIVLYPKKWNKVQVLNWFDLKTSQIHFFGDKYLPGGNDYELITNPNIIPHPIDSPEDTFIILTELLEKIN